MKIFWKENREVILGALVIFFILAIFSIAGGEQITICKEGGYC